MVEWGHKVSLLTGSVEGVKTAYKHHGVNIRRTPLMDLNWLYKRGLRGLEDDVNKVFSDFLEESDPDIIHVHNMHFFSEIHARAIERLAKKKSLPLILTVHNVWNDLLCFQLSHEIDWTHIIAVSHYIKRELIGIGIDDREITVIHHGIDQEKFRPDLDGNKILYKYPQLENKSVIFHPARIGLAKGCDIGIKAFNLLKHRYKDIVLVMGGSKNIIDWGNAQQKDIAYLVSLIKYFKLEDNVLIDVYRLEEIKWMYAASTVCIYPSSVGEPFGLCMLEAMATAKPMVVTNCGGMPEVIENGINGFVIPLWNFEELASRISELLEDEKLRQRLGYTARQMLEEGYTKERVTEDTLHLYAHYLA